MDAEYLDPAVFGDRGNAETFDAAMSRLSHHMAAKDAEIARLRAELEAAQSSINQHLGQTAYRRKEADALIKEIDAAHAALGIGPCGAVTIAEAVESLNRDLAAARAALAKEREACDRFAMCGATTRDDADRYFSVMDEDQYWEEWNAHRQRRAAEAKGLDAYYSDPESRVRVPVDGTEYYRKRAAEANGEPK